MPMNNERLAQSVDKVSDTVDRINSLITELISRLAVLESRISNLDRESNELHENISEIRDILNNLDQKVVMVTLASSNLQESVKILRDSLEGKYVTKAEFEPIKKIIWSVVAAILGAFGVAIFNLLIKK